MPDPQLDVSLAQLLFLQSLRLQWKQEFAMKPSNHEPRRPQATHGPPANQAQPSAEKRPTPWPHHRRFWHRKMPAAAQTASS